MLVLVWGPSSELKRRMKNVHGLEGLIPTPFQLLMYGTRLQKATGKHYRFARGEVADFGRSCLPGLNFAACHVYSACDTTTLPGILTVAQATIPEFNALNAKKWLDTN